MNVDKWCYIESTFVNENPEYLSVILDSSNKVIEGIQENGMKYLGAGMNIGGNEYYVVENPEWIRAVLDSDDKVLCGIKQNGKFYADIDGIDEQVKELIQPLMDEVEELVYRFDEIFKLVDNQEYMSVELDSEEKVLGGRKIDGTKFENVGLDLGGAVLKSMDNTEGRSEVTTDNEGKVISYRDSNGVKHEEVGIKTDNLELSDKGLSDFEKALREHGFSGGCGDWSDAESLDIPEPRCAMINIVAAEGDTHWPTTKTEDLHYWLFFYDMQGNYFKKRIIFNAQGNSTMHLQKKNGAFDLCNDEWEGDDTFKVKFGDWVPQDSFHLKAFYADLTKCRSFVAYDIAQQVADTRGIYENRTWKQALLPEYHFAPENRNSQVIDDLTIQLDNEAKCQPDGFPCVVYLDGEFYGLYVFAMKKHRDNYHMTSDNPKHIHIDGYLYPGFLFNGHVDWTGFEVRNPKYLVYKDPVNGSYKYDADVAQAEIAGLNVGESATPWNAQTSFSLKQVASYKGRMYMSLSDDNIGNDPSAASYKSKPKDVYKKATVYWIEITHTNEVKQHILRLGSVMLELNAAKETSIEAAKEVFSQYFNVNNVTDYVIVQSIVDDGDSIVNNAQLTTWDGDKWFFNNYDKDGSWGMGYCYINKPITTGVWMRGIYKSYSIPFHFFIDNYEDELITRYRELVQLGIININNFYRILREWTYRFGTDNYKLEYKKWPESPCNRDGYNYEYWKIKEIQEVGTDWVDNYDPTRTYNVGDTCKRGYWVVQAEYECIKQCTGEDPMPRQSYSFPEYFGYRDSFFGLYMYMQQTLDVLNEAFNNN